MSLAIRETRSQRRGAGRTPVVLLHGVPAARTGESAENDAFAGALARAGHVCFSVDVRGFGRSERPPAGVNCGPPPLVRGIEIARDLDAAANELRKVSGMPRIGIVQWGAPVGIAYAALWPEKVSHLVLCDMAPDPEIEAPALQPDLLRGDDGAIAGPAQAIASPWFSLDAAAAGGVQTATAPGRLALQDLAPRDEGGGAREESGMNYANHIYCKVMIFESGRDADPGADAEGVAPFPGDFIRAREVRVARAGASDGVAAANGRTRSRRELVSSLTAFLR